MPDSALSDLRVLDLTADLGVYCGKLLADLGADVLQVEPPGGSPLRLRGPFYHHEPHPERNLTWFFLNTNKRSITLNLDSRDGQEILRRLVAGAAVLIEDATPGAMERRGLGYQQLRGLNPGLIYTSITPYGQTGPYARYQATDLTAQAMSGAIYRVGWPHEPPNSTVGGQAANQAGSQAAAAILAAVYSRDLTGAGQQIDVSAHEGMALVDWDALPRYGSGGGLWPRGAGPGDTGVPGASSFHARRIWASRDGKVRFAVLSAVTPAKDWSRLVGWLERYGMASDLAAPAWQELDHRMANLGHIEEVVAAFLESLPAHQAMEEGQALGIQIMAFAPVHALLDDPQLAGEGFFVPVEHPALNDTLTYPGAPYRFSEARVGIRTPAPQIGQHNAEIYQEELGIPCSTLEALKQAGVI